MSRFSNELMPDDNRNLPVVPFRFESEEGFRTYKKQCEDDLQRFYRGQSPLPVPESVAISVLRANVQKRYDHQMELDELKKEDGYWQLMHSGLWETHDATLPPGTSIKKPLDHFMGSSIQSIETGFRITVGQDTEPFNNDRARQNAFSLASIYGYEDGVEINPIDSIKVTRTIQRPDLEGEFVVVKTKTRGNIVGRKIGEPQDYKDAIESVGRRTGVVQLSGLGRPAMAAVKILSGIGGDSDVSGADHRDELKAFLIDEIHAKPEIYEPVIDRFYYTKQDDDR